MKPRAKHLNQILRSKRGGKHLNKRKRALERLHAAETRIKNEATRPEA